MIYHIDDFHIVVKKQKQKYPRRQEYQFRITHKKSGRAFEDVMSIPDIISSIEGIMEHALCWASCKVSDIDRMFYQNFTQAQKEFVKLHAEDCLMLLYDIQESGATWVDSGDKCYMNGNPTIMRVVVNYD